MRDTRRHPRTNVLKARYRSNNHTQSPLSYRMSYTASYYHIVFRTYRSEQTIAIEHNRELYAYIYGIVEYRAFLEENGIAIDERYFLKDD